MKPVNPKQLATVLGPVTGDLHDRILRAHAQGDTSELARLYRLAAEEAEAQGRIDEACFYFTQAYVFALDAGEEEIAADTRTRLVRHGREH